MHKLPYSNYVNNTAALEKTTKVRLELTYALVIQPRLEDTEAAG